MKKAYVSMLLFSLYSIGICMSKKVEDNGAKLLISSKDSCIGMITMFTITIKNTSNEDFWVNQWNMSLILLIGENGEEVKQIKKIEEGSPEIPKFVLLQKNDSISIKAEMRLFERYDMKKELTYNAICIYENSLNKKGVQERTLTGTIKSQPLEIKICE